MKRFFVDDCPGRDFILTGAEHNHLAGVLRCTVDEEITVICGDSFNYIYRIKQIKKHETSLEFVTKTTNLCNPLRHLTVFLAAIKPDNVALVVQKLTELGASELVIFNSARCNISPSSVNIARLNTIARQSCKQCGRSIPLSVRGVISFNQLFSEFKNLKVLFADESDGDLQHVRDVSFAQGESAALVIGPEGGFTKHECEQLRKDTVPVTLGKRILRAETAALAGATIVLAEMGEL